MSGLTPSGPGAKLARLHELARQGAARAARAAKIAERHEHMAQDCSPRLRAFHEAQAGIHRNAEDRHRAVVDLYRHHAHRLGELIVRQRRGEWAEEGPLFIDTLVAITGMSSLCVGLRSVGGADVIVVSDPTALAAHECETILGEGPEHASEVEGPLLATGDELLSRWALYAAAVEPLGVRSVATIPLRVCDLKVGNLTVFGTTARSIEGRLGELCTIGHAVEDILVAEVENPMRDATGLMEGADYRDHVHQASGMVSVQYGCQIADALALLRAHAFAADTDLHSVAKAVIRGDLRFQEP